MKFKGSTDWRELDHTDKHGDDLIVSVARNPTAPRVYITGAACSLTFKQARKFATNLLKELDR